MTRSTQCILAISLCGALLLTGAWALSAGPVDDTFIFLRYASHILDGHGPVYNAGERVEGISSPLWTYVLALGGLSGTDLETLCQWLSLACGVVLIALLVLNYCRNRRTGIRWEVVALFAALTVSPAMIFWSASGMDAPLFALLVTATLLSALADRQGRGITWRTVLLLLVATATRMEAVLLALYIGGVFLFDRRRIHLLGVYVVGIGLMMLARYSFYGSWIPNTYYAKVTYSLGQRVVAGWAYLVVAMRGNGLLIVMTAVTTVLVWKNRPALRRRIAFLLGWIAVWISYVFYAGGDNFAFWRFLMPIFPAGFMLLALSWIGLTRRMPLARRRVVLASVIVVTMVSHVAAFRIHSVCQYGDIAFAKGWSKVGRWIDRNTPEDTVIATQVAGAIAYYSRRTTIDMLGLNDRVIAQEGKIHPNSAHGHTRYHTEYLFARAPDIVVYLTSGRSTKPLYEDPKRIDRWCAYALVDFVNDPRCAELYKYETAKMDDGTLVEMLRRRPSVHQTVAASQ